MNADLQIKEDKFFISSGGFFDFFCKKLSKDNTLKTNILLLI